MAVPTETATVLDPNIRRAFMFADNVLGFVDFIYARTNGLQRIYKFDPFKESAHFAGLYIDGSPSEFVDYLEKAGAADDIDAAMLVANCIHLLEP